MKNNSPVSFWYPVHGNRNILRKVSGVKVASFTGPSGRGITVQQTNGQFRSCSLKKVVLL
jgi:hypothetical protein